MMTSQTKAIAKDKPEEAMIESTTDATTWKIEVERVQPLLKVQIRADAKVVVFGFSVTDTTGLAPALGEHAGA